MKQQMTKKKQTDGKKTTQRAARTPLSARTKCRLLQLQRTFGNHGVLRRYPGVIQAKLIIGQPNDPYEQEADRMADLVMRMPDPRLQSQDAREEGEALIQTKQLSMHTLQADRGLQSQIRSLRGGEPLPRTVRSVLEPRFGCDFSQVRVHSDINADRLARLLGASALTTGQDIFFRQGAYNPGSSGGRELLAHELTHVVQQSRGVTGAVARAGISAPADRYEIEADRIVQGRGNATLMTAERPLSKTGREAGGAPVQRRAADVRTSGSSRPAIKLFSVSTPASYAHKWATGTHELAHLAQQRGSRYVQRKINVESGVSIDGYLVSGATKSGNIYSHPGASQASLDDQIVTDMLYSPRVFSVMGSDDLAAGANLDDHVKARKGIVDFAAKKKYTFAAGSAMTMNPTYWEKVGAGWRVKSGVDPMTAMRDVNITPTKYKIACRAATQITMIAGSGGSPMTTDTGVTKPDWVPGDWGYIKNTMFSGASTDVGLEGENIIYTGNQQFWGHFTGTNIYRTLDEWIDQVRSWHGGADLQDHRTRPTKGLA